MKYCIHCGRETNGSIAHTYEQYIGYVCETCFDHHPLEICLRQNRNADQLLAEKQLINVIVEKNIKSKWK